MCGISLVLADKSCSQNNTTPLLTELDTLLRRRGPDHIGRAKVCAGYAALHITASLLQLRGSETSYAPLTASTYQQSHSSSNAESILAYNGEVFGGLPIQDGQNDGQQLFKALTGGGGDVPAVLSSIRGPWSIIFWDATSNTLWFGRDPIVAVGLKQNNSNPHSQSQQQSSTKEVEEFTALSTNFSGTSIEGSRAKRHALLDNGSNIQPSNSNCSLDGAPRTAAAVVINATSSTNDGDEEGGSSVVPHATTWKPWDHGSDWTEVPPGLYSLTLLPPPSPTPSTTLSQPAGAQNTVLSSNAACHMGSLNRESSPIQKPESCDVTQLADDFIAQQLGEQLQQQVNDDGISCLSGLPQGRIDGSSQQHICNLGGEMWAFQHHPWVDEMANLLSAYERPHHLIAPKDGECIPAPGSVPRSNVEALRRAMENQGTLQQALVSTSHSQQSLIAETSLQTSHANPPQSSSAMCDTQTDRLGGGMNNRSGQFGEVNVSCSDDVSNCQNTVNGQSDDKISVGEGGPQGGKARRKRADRQHQRSKTPQLNTGCIAAQTEGDGVYGVSENTVSAVLKALKQAVEIRCHCIEQHTDNRNAANQQPNEQTCSSLQNLQHLAPAPVLILFSGGVDSTLIAALAHQCLPSNVPIDLSNVCFNNGKSPDRLAAISALHELKRYARERQWRLIMVNASLEDVDMNRDHLLQLLHPAGTVMDLNIGAALWLAVGAKGRIYIPEETGCRAETGQNPDCGTHNAQTSASGGTTAAAGERKQCSDSPSLESKGVINSNSQTDVSSRQEDVEYCSQARVVLLGHGADEQCAGYGRHRTKFALGGWQRLSDELALDVRRIWLRNLGRDDRLTADWGREARHPFLDENFMKTLLQDIALPDIADLYKAPGVGDKRVLRAALASLGLRSAAGRVKRAIQFGSHIGKLSNCREFGSNRQANKASAGTVALKHLEQKQRVM